MTKIGIDDKMQELKSRVVQTRPTPAFTREGRTARIETALNNGESLIVVKALKVDGEAIGIGEEYKPKHKDNGRILQLAAHGYFLTKGEATQATLNRALQKHLDTLEPAYHRIAKMRRDKGDNEKLIEELTIKLQDARVTAGNLDSQIKAAEKELGEQLAGEELNELLKS
jgi:hypothetical protein